MFANGDGIFFQFPGESTTQRILHAATVTGQADGSFNAVFQDDTAQVEPDTELLVYFERNNEFMKQSARINATFSGENDETGDPVCATGENGPAAGQSFSFTTVGSPVSAESRQCFRVSTVVASITVNLKDEFNCPLVDVSATGFSVITDEKFNIGDILPVHLVYDGREFRGSASIQSIRDIGRGKIRYGLHCVDNRSQSADLPKGLQFVSMSVQRQHLRRLRGAG
ncbi:MAG: PilZ domain-containing protein [Phycisphaerales bacterium]